MQKNNAYLKSYYWKNFDADAFVDDIINFCVKIVQFSSKKINPLVFISAFFVFSAQATPQPLLDSDLNDQLLYASSYITVGARTTIGGNVQSATAVTIAANVIVGGNIEAGTTATLGAEADIDGYIEAGTTATLGAAVIVDSFIQAGTTATIGADAVINGKIVAGTTVTIDATVEVGGNVLAGTTVTVGAGSIFHGDIDAGTTTTIGVGVQIDGILTASSLLAPPLPLLVTNQEALITSVQTTLKELGTGTPLVSTTFGINDETLEAGIYSTIDYLSITGGKTLTLDGKGVDGTWIFNIANYLSLAVNAKIILLNVTENSTVIWNILGDKTGSTGYAQLGADAEISGYIFAKGFILTGANTVVEGIGNDCGGAYSATNYIEFGADSVIGQTGCTNAMALSVSQAIAGEPFAACPTDAFLIQDTVATLYGVQLVTGQYLLLSNTMGTTDGLNAMGFNFHDKFIYAWSTEIGQPVRINNDYQVTALTTSGLPNVSFDVGDIAIESNVYYVYRSGAAYGLYAIPLDPSASNYLTAELIIDGSSLDLDIFDMAFHPSNGFAYSVDTQGNLYRIDIGNGSATLVNNIGETGVFGAVYFDVDENLYISRNNDGKIFRINTDEANSLAVLFAYGPSSSNNDGARCALAPVIATDVATIDFGDAPASYGSLADDNGARHSTEDNAIFMGSAVDAEFDSYQFPLSDDVTDGNDDEDGVAFVTGIEVGNSAALELVASTSAFVDAWIDFDGNGVFGSDEKIIDARPVTEGNNTVLYDVPQWASPGNTWARFRISSITGLGPNGGVSDGEVEDYLLDITELGVTIQYYPSASEWATIAFEDNWPSIGDYDFNDLVINYRISEYSLDGEVIRVKLEGQIAAVGASHHNGFAFHLPGISRSSIDENAIRYTINDVLQNTSPLELGRNEAIVIMTHDVWDFVSAGENCKYYRSESGCGSNIQMRFSMTLPLTNAIPEQQMPAVPYDPFLFASEGDAHGLAFGLPPGRAYEIHLPDKAPTEAFRTDFFGRGQDRSEPENERYFVSENGMPWAINVGVEWQYPLEYMDVIYAYPLFSSFIANQGLVDANWYIVENANTNNIFSN
ncbi:MAG: LruC domain-containing protein [Paraglaciecola sp.]|jgi:LruC domain-containing protein